MEFRRESSDVARQIERGNAGTTGTEGRRGRLAGIIEAQMATLNCENQTVFIGDNREVMLGLNSSCVDLIATDPLYNKEKRFDHIFGSPASRRKKKPGFDNKWDGWMTLDRVPSPAQRNRKHPPALRPLRQRLSKTPHGRHLRQRKL